MFSAWQSNVFNFSGSYYKPKPIPEPPGIIAHYKFENNLLDEELTNDLNNSGCTFSTNSPPVGAYFLNATDPQFASNTSITGMNFGTNDMSISFFVKSETVDGTSNHIINLVNYTDDNNFSTIGFRYYNDFSIFLEKRTGGAFNDSFTARSTQAFNVSTWYHVVMIRTGGTISLYVNAQLETLTSVNSVGSPQNIVLDTKRLYLFRTALGQGSHQGDIDDLRIYDRALTQTEVQYLYDLRN